MLILDLDNTIFPTNSIPFDSFLPAVKVVEKHLFQQFDQAKSHSIIEELWNVPFDSVSKKYNFPEKVNADFYKTIQTLDYDLKIKTYADYPFFRKLNHRKILVTTGFKKLQFAKIRALGINDDFEAVFIDDPSDSNRIFKKGIFENILKKENLQPSEVWVIGDNPNSEIAAAKALGIRTIQVIRPETNFEIKGDFSIHSFEEIAKMISE